MESFILPFDLIECDNGKAYTILSGGHGSFYNRRLWNSNEVVNETHDYYLDDCFKYGDPICVGMKNRNLEYARIMKVYDFRGKLKNYNAEE